MTRRLAFWSGLSVGLLWVSTSCAEPTAADRATARSLAGEGYQALQDKDYATAADRFRRADALIHAPTLMIDWARSLVGLGKLVEAQERYEQILREGVDAKAPKPWQRALKDAGSELTQLKPRLAWITISVSGSDDARLSVDEAHVTIDGAPVPTAALGVRRAVNPGSLQVRVQAKGFLGQKKTVELREGAEEALTFQLEPDPELQASSLVKSTPPAEAPVTSHKHTPMYVAFGVSAAGLAVGAITGGLALSKNSDLSAVCNADHDCPSSHEDTLRAYHTFGTLSAVGFGVGVAGAGVGVTMWLMNRGKGNATPTHGVVVHPYVGLGSVGAVGSF
ncbi:MAG TPA: hypothetical protein VER04_07070 [Polyangiaceae bacterium]|nr:hypothetical protein [Polyangiaceae bacterium]